MSVESDTPEIEVSTDMEQARAGATAQVTVRSATHASLDRRHGWVILKAEHAERGLVEVPVRWVTDLLE